MLLSVIEPDTGFFRRYETLQEQGLAVFDKQIAVIMMAFPPMFLQWLTYLSPLRYYVTATLGIFLKGIGFDILWPQALALTIFGLVMLSISTWRLRRNLADV